MRFDAILENIPVKGMAELIWEAKVELVLSHTNAFQIKYNLPD
jgi:hypothetical protein